MEIDYNLVKNPDIKDYEWVDFYKEPSKLKINQEYIDMYWYFIFERMKIWYNRVVLNQEFPWTKDRILIDNRFTNVSRDLDKLSIYEVKNIISKIDEPVDDIELRKKSVFFNILIFRTYVKAESYECFGFLDLADKDFKLKYESGKKKLLELKESGGKIFTGSYMVNSLSKINPDPKTRKNKVCNTYVILDYVLDNIDELYEIYFHKCSNMKEQIKELQKVKGIGSFNAYELACSFACADRFCNNTLVPWTQDNYSNIGPGSSRGLDKIFKDYGNLKQIDALIYLRSIWKQEFKRLGCLDEMLKIMPDFLNGELSLREIEHCLCEFHKYSRAKDENKGTRLKFKPETKNVEELKTV